MTCFRERWICYPGRNELICRPGKILVNASWKSPC